MIFWVDRLDNVVWLADGLGAKKIVSETSHVSGSPSLLGNARHKEEDLGRHGSSLAVIYHTQRCTFNCFVYNYCA